MGFAKCVFSEAKFKVRRHTGDDSTIMPEQDRQGGRDYRLPSSPSFFSSDSMTCLRPVRLGFNRQARR